MSNLYSNSENYSINQDRLSGEPDLSNPYSYPANPNPAEDISSNSNILQSSFNNSLNGDPEIAKLKNSFWKRAGQLQTTIGSLAGVESWKTNGVLTEEEAERSYREADERMQLGEPSRFHGEFERAMGLAGYALGHIVGDSEMQIKASKRTENGLNEINKSQR